MMKRACPMLDVVFQDGVLLWIQERITLVGNLWPLGADRGRAFVTR